MQTLQNAVDALFRAHPGVLHGVCNIAYSPYGADYAQALVFAVPHRRILTLESYAENDFEDLIQAARTEVSEILEALETLFQQNKISYLIPQMSQTDEIDLLAPFSFKYAATRAGLGWIGKSDTLLTKEYGPRVRLCAVLADTALPVGTPVTESRCPAACTRCFDACPSGALKNVRWVTGEPREKRIDVHACNSMRSAMLLTHGRKNACGLCMAACPFGARV